MLGVLGVITLVKPKVPPETFKSPRIAKDKLARLVSLKDPVLVLKTLKFPAIVAPFKPPNKFTFPV